MKRVFTVFAIFTLVCGLASCAFAVPYLIAKYAPDRKVFIEGGTEKLPLEEISVVDTDIVRYRNPYYFSTDSFESAYRFGKGDLFSKRSAAPLAPGNSNEPSLVKIQPGEYSFGVNCSTFIEITRAKRAYDFFFLKVKGGKKYVVSCDYGDKPGTVRASVMEYPLKASDLDAFTPTTK